jgi:hypothetical protein
MSSEEFPIGTYTISADLTNLIIHNAMISTSPEQGRYYRNDEFRVFQILPVDRNGIVWGRVTENVEGNVRYVGLKVGANKKVILLRTDSEPVPTIEDVYLLLKRIAAKLGA